MTNVARAETITFDYVPAYGNGTPIDGGDLGSGVGGYGSTSKVNAFSGVYNTSRLGNLQWYEGSFFGDLDNGANQGVARDTTFSDLDGDNVADAGTESYWGEFRLEVWIQRKTRLRSTVPDSGF